MPYDLDMTDIQADIAKYFEDTFSEDIVLDGAVDQEAPSKSPNGSIKPFMILQFGGLRRAPRGRSFGGTRMDSYRSGFDVLIVAPDGPAARDIKNSVDDSVIGRKFKNCGEAVKGSAIFENARAVLDAQNKPSRYVTTSRFDFGVFQKRTA